MIRCGLFLQNRMQKAVSDQSGESIHQGCIKEKKKSIVQMTWKILGKWKRCYDSIKGFSLKKTDIFIKTLIKLMNKILLLVQGAEGVSRGVLKWSSSHTHTTDPSSSAMLLAGQGKHSCCLDDIL